VLGSASSSAAGADPAQVLLQTDVCADCAIREAMEARERLLREVGPVSRAIEPVLNLEQRGFCEHQETLEFGWIVPAESLRSVRTRRVDRIAELVAESPIVTRRRPCSKRNHLTPQLVRELPDDELLKATSTHMYGESITRAVNPAPGTANPEP
jgi:hypothetical protein